jgi:hypothetical protein
VLRQRPASADLADLAGRLGRAGAEALPQLASQLGRAGAALPRGGRIAAAAVGGLLVLLALAWILVPSRPERLIEAGRLEEARAAIQALELRRGQDDDEVLYLHARLEEERWHRGQTGPREAFRLYGRALGAGSAAAAHALARHGESTDCGTRRLAAHALSDSHSRKAISALREIAAGEEAEPEAKDAIDKVRRLFGGGGRCGAGDVARDGLRAIEEES